MANKTLSQPVARTYTVVDLVAAAQEGRIRIPEFQRPLRWQWEDVRGLFDSIVKGYPIGNLLLWKRPAPEDSLTLGALNLKAKQFDEGWWVVDGQQRITSMANALTTAGASDERFALAYDLNKQVFVRPIRGASDGFVVPLPVLFDLQQLIRWFTKDHPEASEKLDDASRVTRAIREYQVPAYLVDQDDEAVLRDIFDRMNNYGKRLSRAEVFVALHPGKIIDSGLGSHFQQIATLVHAERGFGIIDDDTVLRAILARRGGNVSRDIRVEFSSAVQDARYFGAESPEVAYKEGGAALLRAVAFLQGDAGIPHFSFLPYRYLMVVLTRFFSHYPEPSPRNRQLLRRWFWRAASIGPGPFSSSWTNAMSTLSARVTPGDESGTVQKLLQEPLNKSANIPKLTGFKTSAAEGRIVLSALWSLKPRSLMTGQPYEKIHLAEAIQVDGTLADVALRIFSREPENFKALAANRLIVLDTDLFGSPRDMLVSPPLGRTGDDDAILASHCLNKELVSHLANGEKILFLENRKLLIAQVVRDFMFRMAEPDLEDTPPLACFNLDDAEEVEDE
ncbi:MAG: hypothetical protein RL456_458 [Pseudomonadota bacterium]|jgi:hypothetical protein